MALFELQYRELLPSGVDMELDQLTTALNATFEQNHDGDSGEHTDIQVDSIEARNTNNIIPVTGSLRFLKGRILIDAVGNSTHIAGLRPTMWTTHVNNYNPSDAQHAFMIECDTDADRNITGLNRVNRQKQLIIFGNRGNFNITFKHDNAGSLYYNRFGLPNNTDLVVGSGEYIWLYYDVGSEIWRLVGAI